jgi:16S rRNA (uracil1498-N3)-methyltransferase
MTELTEPGGKVRLFVGDDLGAALRVEPSPDQAHYLQNVMRVKVDDRVCLFNGRDGEWVARVESITKRTLSLACERQSAIQREVPDLWLAFAPVKKIPTDYLAQKATELGVRVLQPLFTRRTIVKRVNIDRMRANAIEAAEQSGRVSVPECREALSLEKVLAAWPEERPLIFCDEAGQAPMLIDALLDVPEGAPSGILIGPEGGFDPAERDLVRSLPQAIPVMLGYRILRADTAALAALAVWQSVWGDWR